MSATRACVPAQPLRLRLTHCSLSGVADLSGAMDAVVGIETEFVHKRVTGLASKTTATYEPERRGGQLVRSKAGVRADR